MKTLHRSWQVVLFEDEAVPFFQFGPACVPFLHGARWFAGCWVRRLQMCASAILGPPAERRAAHPPDRRVVTAVTATAVVTAVTATVVSGLASVPRCAPHVAAMLLRVPCPSPRLGLRATCRTQGEPRPLLLCWLLAANCQCNPGTGHWAPYGLTSSVSIDSTTARRCQRLHEKP
jgi:hypothetical protein